MKEIVLTAEEKEILHFLKEHPEFKQEVVKLLKSEDSVIESPQ